MVGVKLNESKTSAIELMMTLAWSVWAAQSLPESRMYRAKHKNINAHDFLHFPFFLFERAQFPVACFLSDILRLFQGKFSCTKSGGIRWGPTFCFCFFNISRSNPKKEREKEATKIWPSRWITAIEKSRMSTEMIIRSELGGVKGDVGWQR